MSRFYNFFLLTTAFFEGGAVMASELLGAKLMAPYYGSSLYVWAGVLGVTLAGLAGGYFTGSRLSKRNDAPNLLFILLFAGALAVAIMPMVASHLVEMTLELGLRRGIVLSCISLLFIPLFCFGTISPLMIRALATAGGDGGKITGNVYAISTAGGIVLTIFTGFYFIPQWGLSLYAYFIAGITAFFPLTYFTLRNTTRPLNER